MQEIARAGLRDGEWEHLRPIIDDSLSQLGDGDREVVLLRFFANLPFAQIGARLSVTENAARMRSERALERLRVLIARRGVTSTAVALGLALESQASTALVPTGLATSVTSSALALGTAPPGATAVATIAGFMSSMKLSIGVGAAVLLATAIGIATDQFQSSRSDIAELAGARHALADLAARQEESEKKLRLAEQAAAELKRQVEEKRVAPAAATASAESAAPAWDPMAQGAIFMERHPSVHRSLEAYAKARAHFRYSPIYAPLGLRPDQIDEFQSLMSRGVGMGAQGPDGNYSNRWLSLVTKGPLPSSTEYNERVRALIGDEGMRKLSEYGRSEPGRDLASKVAGELWGTDTPLTSQQADRLVEVLTEQRTWRAAMPGSRSPGYDWNAILAQTSGFLTETQLGVLKGMQARDQFIQAINRTPAPDSPAAKKNPASRE